MSTQWSGLRKGGVVFWANVFLPLRNRGGGGEGVEIGVMFEGGVILIRHFPLCAESVAVGAPAKPARMRGNTYIKYTFYRASKGLWGRRTASARGASLGADGRTYCKGRMGDRFRRGITNQPGRAPPTRARARSSVAAGASHDRTL